MYTVCTLYVHCMNEEVHLIKFCHIKFVSIPKALVNVNAADGIDMYCVYVHCDGYNKF